jgi:hypothetical protein
VSQEPLVQQVLKVLQDRLARRARKDHLELLVPRGLRVRRVPQDLQVPRVLQASKVFKDHPA